MKLNFVKVNPVENMTVFILDEVDRNKHIEISKKLMDYSNLYAEQVGFIEKPIYTDDISCKVRLQMMGNEFCGNATRSLAALLVHNNHSSVEKIEDTYYVKVETSGIDTALVCVVKKVNDNNYSSKIEMPLPLKRPQKLIIGEKEVYRADFSGITHFIVNSAEVKNKEVFFDIVKEYIEDELYEAFGIMYYNFETCFMEPLVYVKATDSLFWERSCASGTSAIGAMLTYLNESDTSLSINQPGGILEISTVYDNQDIKKIMLDGKVEIVAQGIVNV